MYRYMSAVSSRTEVMRCTRKNPHENEPWFESRAITQANFVLEMQSKRLNNDIYNRNYESGVKRKYACMQVFQARRCVASIL